MLSFPPTTYEKMAYVKAVIKKQSGMPDQLVNLTSHYLPLQSNFDLALHPLKFDRYGNVTNLNVRQMIREALISNVCELRIKRQIFVNMVAERSRFYLLAFDRLLQEIDDSGYLVNLDCIDLSHLELTRIKLINTSLRYADFTMASIHSAAFTGSDLSGATFADAQLRLVNMEITVLNGVTWTGASLSRINLTGATEVDLHAAKTVSRIYLDDQEISRRGSGRGYHQLKLDTYEIEDPVSLELNRPCCCVIQ